MDLSPITKFSGQYDIITVLGATAGGKTAFAAHLADLTGREIISADSRQVYRQMDIGTGKDLNDYIVEGRPVPVHLVDIVEPGEKYNVYRFQQDFVLVWEKLSNSGKKAVMCGGSGMYIEAILKDYELISVPFNPGLRESLDKLDTEKLIEMLASKKKLHNTSDTKERSRLIRALEIAEYYSKNSEASVNKKPLNHLVLGIKFDRESRRRRISERLKQRLSAGMIDEVKNLLDHGISKETLIYYGLEYKFITLYLDGVLEYNEMVKQLETAIHQFSKRQMTWFRKMERDGIKIHWLDGYMSMEQKLERLARILEKLNKEIHDV
ncbi:MAG: tRNA (adenosine(37)-N6)-dimethylallyltransferase MiaA [Bacteroidales bacterium]